MTDDDWDALIGQRTSVQGRMQVLVARFVSIGLYHPHEQTLKWAVAAIASAVGVAHGGAFAPFATVFGMVRDFKNMMDGAKRPWSFSYIVRYPEQIPIPILPGVRCPFRIWCEFVVCYRGQIRGRSNPISPVSTTARRPEE